MVEYCMMYNAVYFTVITLHYIYISEVSMLNNGSMRPAYATAGTTSANRGANENSQLCFSQGRADEDFNAFGNQSSRAGASASRSNPQRQPQQKKPRQSAPAPKKRSFLSNLNPKILLIGAVAIVAVVLLIFLLVAIFSAPGKGVVADDNVYIFYESTEEDGYRILSNGKEVDYLFEGEIELVPAKDNSFAYVFEDTLNSNGDTVIKMYILKGKRLKPVEAVADKIITYAEYEPGIIFKRGSIVQFYSENAFEEISSGSSSDNFLISGDATTLIYTEVSGRERDTTTLKCFLNKSGLNDVEDTEGLIPVSISIDGKYVYAYAEDNSLYYIKISGNGEEFEKKTIVSPTQSSTFTSINSINADGDEIVFSYTKDGKAISFIHKVGNKELERIGEGIFTYLPADGKTVAPSSLVNSYYTVESTVQNDEGENKKVISTCYYNGKETRKLANEIGKFSPDGKYFYYIDDETSYLVRISLDSKDYQKDAKMFPTSIDSFVVTEKGDLYTYSGPKGNEGGKIIFREASNNSSESVSFEADADSMFLCGNSIYFSETDDDTVKVYVSVNGATKEEVTFKKSSFETPLTIEMGTGDRGYAYFVDSNDDTKLLYTSNGKTFSIVCESCIIPGYSVGDITPPSTDEEPDAEEETEAPTDEATDESEE